MLGGFESTLVEEVTRDVELEAGLSPGHEGLLVADLFRNDLDLGDQVCEIILLVQLKTN